MPTRIVGLDFGTRSIKLLELDTREMIVESFDEEMLPLEAGSYLPDKHGDFQRGESSSEAGDHAETEGAGPNTEEDAETSAAPAPPSADQTQWLDALEALLERHEFDKDTVFVSFLPDDRGISLHEEVPFAEPSKVASILPNLLEDRLPLDPSEIVYDFKVLEWDQGRSEGDKHTTIVGLGRKRDLRFFLDHLEEAGVNPAHLGLPELMHRYTLEATTSCRTGTEALVDLGHRFTRVLVLDEGEPVMARSVQFGGWDITRAIAEEFDVTLEQAENYKERAGLVASGEAPDQQTAAVSELIRRELRSLVRDLRRNFQSLYASDDVQLERLHLCGGTSRIDNIEAYLSDQFGLEVRPLPMKSAIDYGIVPGEIQPKTALALGMALQPERDRSGDRLIDLRQGEFAFSGRSSFMHGQMVKFGAVAAALFVLFVGTLWAKKYELDAKHAAMKSAVAQQTEELLGRSLTKPDLIEKAATGSPKNKQAFAPGMSAYQLLHAVMKKLEQDVTLNLDRIDVDVDRQFVRMAGSTPDADVNQIITRIKTLACVKEDDINQQPVKVSADKTRFNIEINNINVNGDCT